MSIVDHHGEVEYPFSQKTVFRAIMEAAPIIKGISLDSADELSGSITFKAGMSLASWGENIPVQLIQVSTNRTRMKVLSTPKTGIMFGGAMDFGKNRENINKIINSVSNILSKYPAEDEMINGVDLSEKLIKIKQLLDQKALTEEEYKEERKRILDLEITNNSSITPTPQSLNEPPIRIIGKGNESANSYALIGLIIFILVFLFLMMI